MLNIIICLSLILPVSAGPTNCAIACTRCKEEMNREELWEVYCAMCTECKERRREWFQDSPDKSLELGKVNCLDYSDDDCPPQPCDRSTTKSTTWYPPPTKSPTTRRTCPPVWPCDNKPPVPPGGGGPPYPPPPNIPWPPIHCCLGCEHVCPPHPGSTHRPFSRQYATDKYRPTERPQPIASNPNYIFVGYPIKEKPKRNEFPPEPLCDRSTTRSTTWYPPPTTSPTTRRTCPPVWPCDNKPPVPPGPYPPPPNIPWPPIHCCMGCDHVCPPQPGDTHRSFSRLYATDKYRPIERPQSIASNPNYLFVGYPMKEKNNPK